MNVLLTGFEPFDKDPLNPSWEVARALDGWQPAVKDGACTVRAVQLPTPAVSEFRVQFSAPALP